MNAPALRVQYVTSSDGYRLAYRVTGSGIPCVHLPGIWSHLEHKALPQQAWRDGFAERFRLVEYDNRGQGLSSRGLSDKFAMADLVIDLETNSDHLALEKPLLGAVGTATHTAIRFAARHPDRVRALILVSASLITGPTWPVSLVAEDWEGFLTMLASVYGSFEELQRARDRLASMLNQDDAVRLFRASQLSRIEDEVAQVGVPTLVLHPRRVEHPSLQQSAELAAAIRGAQLAEIEGGFPSMQGETDSAMPVIDDFVANLPPPALRDGVLPQSQLHAPLSVRELEVLRLLAAGRSNQQIAGDLVISANTVAKHVTSILTKTGSANRVEAATYAHRHRLI